MPRFFVTGAPEDGAFLLVGDDAHHIARSLRCAVGDTVTVCDGEGTEYTCRLTQIRDDAVTATVLDACAGETELPLSVHLLVAYPKGDKLETVVQKATELGATRITPFESSRCIKRPGAEKQDKITARLARIAEEAAKQCGRSRLPEVDRTVSFDGALSLAAKSDLVLFCYEGAAVTPLPANIERAAPALDAARAEGRTPEIAIFVGSEGGFSPEEAEAASARGFAMTGLGKRILRTETASGFVLSCLIYALEL